MERAKRLRNGTLVFYYGFTLFAAIRCMKTAFSVYNLLLVLAAALLPAVPHILYRVCRLKPVPLLEAVFDWFVWAAVPFASLFGAYDMIPYWDKILHCLSGFLFATLGMVVYFSNKSDHTLEKRDAFNASAYSFMFAVTSAALWEIWEFIVSFSGADPQQVAATGVTDTMGDIIVCTVGGLLTACACWRYLRHLGENRRKGLMMSLFEAYYNANLQ